MNALIFENKVIQVSESTFEVYESMFWVACTSEVTTAWTYIDGVFIPPPTSTAEENKATAVSLLQATDWTQIPSVSDPSLSNPYLANKLAFDQYRNDVRQYAVYPVAGDITWPIIPTENWTSL